MHGNTATHGIRTGRDQLQNGIARVSGVRQAPAGAPAVPPEHNSNNRITPRDMSLIESMQKRQRHRKIRNFANALIAIDRRCDPTWDCGGGGARSWCASALLRVCVDRPQVLWKDCTPSVPPMDSSTGWVTTAWALDHALHCMSALHACLAEPQCLRQLPTPD